MVDGLKLLMLHWCFINVECKVICVTTLTLSSRPRQGLARVRAKRKPRSRISCSKECRRVQGNEPSQSQVSSHLENWSLDGFSNLQKTITGVKTHWIKKFFISLENLLECRCLKWARMTHLDTWNTSYGQKKGWELNWQFDFRPLKVENRPNVFSYMWSATYHWKYLNKGYNFSSNLISIKGLHKKLWAPKVAKVPTLGMSFAWQNDIWVLVPWQHTEYTIRGKVVASLKSEPWWVLWIYVCSWFIHAPKCFNYALTNLFLVCARPCE
jgi:hypothetical protein